METNNLPEIIAKLQDELQTLKETNPKEYLELLKTLNSGIAKINDDMDKALGK